MKLLSVSSVVQECVKKGFHLSEDSVRRYADLGILPCMRTEKNVRLFALSDVDAFIIAYKNKKQQYKDKGKL